MSQGKRLRELLKQDGILIAPGAYDCLTAKLVEQAGFSAVYMTGAGTAAGRLGLPDYGLATMSEMIQNASAMAGAVEIPVIADADTGFGNALNVIRAVQEYERGGAAGIHIEDQVFPKKCGHLDNKEVIPEEEFLAKIRAAVRERRNPDFYIIARTDARAGLGLEEAVRRANEALAAGADMAFVEALQSLEEIKEIPRRVKGPCLLNVVPGGKTPAVSLQEAEAWGYKLAILPGVTLFAVIGACDEALSELRETGSHPVPDNAKSIRETFRRLGSERWDEWRDRYK